MNIKPVFVGKIIRKSRLLCVMCVALCGLAAGAVQPAFALSSFETNATRDSASGTASDPRGPVSTGSLFSEVLLPFSDGSDIVFSGQGYARGAANDTGAGAVGVNGAFFSGSLALNSLTASSILTSQITNNTGGAVPFAYDYFMPGPTLTLSDFAGMSDLVDPTITVFFDFRISLDFGSGYLPRVVSQGQLKGGYVSHTLGTDGTDPLGSTFFINGTFPNNVFGYQFDDLDGMITGSLLDGQTVSVKSSLFVSVMAPGFETGGAARIGDPLDLSAGAFSGSLNIVPVPPAVWLFGSGLIGLIGLARRRNRD